MNRFLDLLLASIILVVMAVPALFVALAVKLTSPGPVLYWSSRVGRDNRLFSMPKFRTMRADTPAVATHLLEDSHSVLTPIGGILRRTSLDELPQLWSIFCNDMAIVGPRPALFNQDDLVALRTEAGVHRVKPGITGWAQVSGRDTLTIPEKVALDREYMLRRGLFLDIAIIGRTALRIFGDNSVSH